MVSTPAALFDYLQQRFGIGDWDESMENEIPFWKFRGTETAKIKALLKRRHTSIDDVVLAAEYAIAQSKPIHATWQLFSLIDEAKRAYRLAARATPTLVRQQVLDAAADALGAGEGEWAARLFAADEASGAAVLQEWLGR